MSLNLIMSTFSIFHYINIMEEEIKHELSNIKIQKKKFSHTEETKLKISELKKELYKNNPEKHNWKRTNKLVSKPCENFKKIIEDLGIKYISEFTPLENRFFSIDIAFPDKKIGIEINGNQHYELDGTLKEYYKERHRLIENDGWILHEIHFSICFNKEVVRSLMESILKNSDRIFEFDYEKYLLDKLNYKKQKLTCKCGSLKYKYSERCKNCRGVSQRKVTRPDINNLIKEINSLGYCGVGRKYGVSDNTIRMWLKKNNIDTKLVKKIPKRK